MPSKNNNRSSIKADAVALARKVITEVYGQKASQKKINEVAERIVAAIPQKPMAPPTEHTCQLVMQV